MGSLIFQDQAHIHTSGALSKQHLMIKGMMVYTSEKKQEN